MSSPFCLSLALLGFLFSTVLSATETIEFEGGLYHIQKVPAQDYAKLDFRWLHSSGKPLSNFGALQKQLSSEGKNILFATNAGIYERGPKPCGLTISASKELVPLNLAAGEGNFYLKPNGVFYLDEKAGPGIVEASEYPALRLQPRFANQSGPLLLRQGVIHPAFNINSPNRRQRSAVGIVTSSQEILFVMSDREDREKGRVTFHQLSRFFLHLGCQDALFLDGDISQMITSPAPNIKFTPNTFAGMFVVTD